MTRVLDGQTIKRARELRADGLTCEEVGAILGVSRTTVGKYAGSVETVRSCALCGERFLSSYAKRVFCQEYCACKYKRLYGGGYKTVQRRKLVRNSTN